MSVDKKQLKEALLKTLAEKGDYTTILSHLSSEEKEEKDSQFKELIRPMSAVADILVSNATGAFTEPINKRIDDSKEELRTQFAKELADNKKELSEAISEAFSGRNSEFTKEILEKLTESQGNLSSTLTQLTAELVGEKAAEMLSGLGEQAKLTEDEIEDIIERASLAVESQITTIIGQYIDEQGISVSQIRDFTENVQKLLPQVDFSKISVDWSQVRNAPSQGGTNANLIRQIAQEIVDASGGGYTDLTEFVDQTPHRVFYSNGSGDVTELALGADGTYLKSNGATSAPSFATPAGSGDVVGPASAVNNNFAAFDTTTGKLIKDSGVSSASFAAALGADDNYVTDAEKAALHAALTVTDSSEIDFTLTGQDLTASIVAGSIDETKLDASVNASLDLADSALQAGDIATAFPTFMFSSTNSDISGYESAPSLNLYTAAAEANNGGTAASTTPAIMEEFATDVGYPNITLLPAGLITIHFETTKGAGANNYYCYAEVYKRVLAGTETLLATSDNSTLSALNTRVQQTVTATLAANVTLLATDRIVVKVYCVMVSSTATITLYYDDATNARIELPPVSIDAATLVTIATAQTITGAKTFSADVIVPDEAYDATAWNGSLEVPTKNAVRDKIESLSAGGITRSISSIATPTTAGGTASTDYVYFVTNTTLTLPTAVSNTNRYTVKCISGTCVIDGAGAETIDGTATITVQVEDSVDLISNNTEFKVV